MYTQFTQDLINRIKFGDETIILGDVLKEYHKRNQSISHHCVKCGGSIAYIGEPPGYICINCRYNPLVDYTSVD